MKSLIIARLIDLLLIYWLACGTWFTHSAAVTAMWIYAAVLFFCYFFASEDSLLRLGRRHPLRLAVAAVTAISMTSAAMYSGNFLLGYLYALAVMLLALKAWDAVTDAKLPGKAK